MNWVDAVILSLIGFSALLAFMRGLVREVLGIGTWIGAGFFAAWAHRFVDERFHHWIKSPDIAEIASYGVMFLVALIFLSVVASIIGGVVRASMLGGVDRTLGVVFGLIRGAGVIVLAYIVGGMVVPPDRWPEPMREARSLDYIYQGAKLAVGLLPPEYRPTVPVPPDGPGVKAAELLRVNPQGRAIAHP